MYFSAGVVGIEPTVFALEASGLPLTDTPITMLEKYNDFIDNCKGFRNYHLDTRSKYT